MRKVCRTQDGSDRRSFSSHEISQKHAGSVLSSALAGWSHVTHAWGGGGGGGESRFQHLGQRQQSKMPHKLFPLSVSPPASQSAARKRRRKKKKKKKNQIKKRDSALIEKEPLSRILNPFMFSGKFSSRWAEAIYSLKVNKVAHNTESFSMTLRTDNPFLEDFPQKKGRFVIGKNKFIVTQFDQANQVFTTNARTQHKYCWQCTT